MNNTTRRRVAALTVALVGLTVAAVVSSHHTSTEVVTGDDTTTSGAATSSTTAVPETTTAESTTTTVAPATTVVETTVPPTTTVVTEPPAPAPTTPSTTAAGLSTQEDTGVQPVGAGDPAQATRAGTKCVAADPAECNPPTTPARTAWRYCEQWHELAAEVGWPESAGPTLSYVMHRESGCDPNAYNRSGATGLMQLLGHSCGGSCFDPANNLRTALALYNGRHWCDWVLRGDPVTGHACG